MQNILGIIYLYLVQMEKALDSDILQLKVYN